MTPIEAAVKAGRQHVIALSASNADPRQFSQVEARIIIAAFLEAAAMDMRTEFEVERAILRHVRPVGRKDVSAGDCAKAAILALKEAVNG